MKSQIYNANINFRIKVDNIIPGQTYTFAIYIELKNGDYLLSRKKNVQMLYEKLKLEVCKNNSLS